MSILALPLYPTDFGGSIPSKSTDTTKFDASYTPHALDVSLVKRGYNTNDPATFTISHAESGSEYWLHFQLTTSSNLPAPSSNCDGNWIRFYTASGDLMAALTMSDGYVKLQVEKFTDGSGTVFSGTTYEFLPGTTNVFDVRLTMGADTTLTLYVGGAEILTVSAPQGNLGVSGIARTEFTHADMFYIGASSTSTFHFYFSEMVITGSEATLGWRVAAMEVAAAGNYTDWVGDPAAMADDDLATMVLSDTPDQRVSFTPSAYSGPASPATIRGVFTSSTLTTGDGAPQNVAPFLRIGGVDYDSASAPVDVQTIVVGEYNTNPATGVDWTTADLAAFEFGLLSAA